MGVRFYETTGAPLYGEWLNSHFLRLRKSELQHSFENNLITGYMFGPKLVTNDPEFGYLGAQIIEQNLSIYFLRMISSTFHLTLLMH